ncbi:MAG: exodeoxyribonuclease VII small subunit [Nocardioidaceae bacterium]
MTESPSAPDPDLSYEDARDELLTVVQRLETGGVSLQESVALWERGEQLADICQRWLDGARARLDAVTRREDS